MLSFHLNLLLLLASAAKGEAYCRNLHFTHEVLEGWALKGHGIKPIQPSGDEEDCQLKCYFEERCVSYNYGNGGCELNESDHIQSPHDLVKAAGTLYRASQNFCRGNKCSPQSKCLSGFTSKGYECACPEGRTGEYCETEFCLKGAETTGGECCVFPFVYQGTSYSSCSAVNHDRPWCYTVPNYEIERKWGDCKGHVHVRIRAEGAEDPGMTPPWGITAIFINGVDYSLKMRGHNLVAIHPNLTIHSTAAFDTHGDRYAGSKMSAYIDSIPIGTAVVVATQDAASHYYQFAVPALRSLGATDPLRIGFRDSWWLVGYKGGHKPWITEGHAEKGQGPATADLIIQLE